MAELIKVNKKVINDPLYTPVIAFLKDRIANLEITGPEDELALSKQRYDGLVAGDLVIESAVRFPDDVVRVSIISRKTGFARVDIDIKYAQMKNILEDFAVPLVEIEDIDHLKTYVKALAEPIQPTLLYLKYKETYGVLITQDQAKTHEGTMTAFGELFFESYVLERESLNSIDWETLECGTVTITDPSFGRGVYPLFIYELVLSEAQLPEITSNLPTEITSRRGESFVIPNTYWFAGTQDITTTATVELSTQSGYAILDRSSDLLQIDGETIYGSSTENVADVIVVRVSYDWNGRIVRKNFRIALTIEKDLPNDLVITSVPTQVTATSGDVVELALTATYKGDKTEILIPPSMLKSQKGFGNLTYVKTNKDLSMVYRGTVRVSFPTGVEQVADLWSAEFSINDGGTVVKATGYVNSILVKPEALPKFSVTDVPTLLEGFKGDVGAYAPIVKYGDQVIPIDEVNLSIGVQGTKQLVDITSVSKTSVYWELVNDSGNPGQPIRDTFTQTYSWLDPRGVLQSQSFTIVVNVKLNSIIKVIQGAAKHVRRYQAGGVTWVLEVNGANSNGLIRSFSLDTPLAIDDVDYIINRPMIANQWFVVNADPDKELTFTGKFTFTALVDGSVQTFHVDQEFIVDKLQTGTKDGDNSNPPPVNDDDPNNPGGGPAPGEKGTGPGGNTGPDDPTAPGGAENPNSPGTGDGPYNTEITAVPTSFTIAGNSDKSYQLTFKVYKGTEDVTASSELMTDYTVTPEFITFDKMSYDATNNVFLVKYTKNKGGVSEGAIFAKLKDNATPTKKQIARVWLNVNIVQIKILKFIDPPKSVDLTVTESKDVPINVEFSGTKIALNDPNLKIVKTIGNNTNVTAIGADALTVLNDVWSYIGRTVTDAVSLQFTYKDPDGGALYTQVLPINFPVTYPPMELIYTGERELDVSIWDTGKFPIKLQAGNTDFTSKIIRTEIVSGNKYVKINGLNWEVYFAESTATSQIVGLNVAYSVGFTSDTIPADFKFNIAAWDGITFAATKYAPETIDAKSGDTGEITASFVFKGKDGTEFTQFVPSASTIPETVVLGTVSYDADKGLVIPYSLKLGGEGVMKLVFSAPGTPTITTTVTINTKVAWPHDLNIVNSGSDIRGYWNENYTYPLVLNFAGTPVALTDGNLALTFSSGEGDPIELTETLEKSLTLLLAQGGDLGKTYDYDVTIDLVYTDQTDGSTYPKQLKIPAAIRVPDVKVGSNPVITANVFDRGEVQVTLVDERGAKVPITSYGQSDSGANVILYDANIWYVTSGPVGGSLQGPGTLPLRLWFQMGGKEYSIDVIEEFKINPWDGNYFSVKPDSADIVGIAGDTGEIAFDIKYQGFKTTGNTVDLKRSNIPDNIAIGEFDEDNNLSYTLSGNDETSMVICVVRNGAVEPMKEGMDYLLVDFTVKTTSSNLPFTLVSNDDAITLDWGKTGTIKFVTKYGDKEIPSNAPGLTVKLADAAVHGITIVRLTKDGVVVKATRSNVPGATKVYPEMFNVSYEVGAPEPKTVSFDSNATISMGPVSIDNNNEVKGVIWSTGTFQQKVKFNDTTLNTVDHFELQQAENKYIEVTQPRGYEIVGAEPTTSTQAIPMVIFYKVDETDELQKLNFDASFTITGSTSVRFKVDVTPTSVEGSLDNESVVTCTPIYKDKYVGGSATFKPALSTIPEQLTLKDYKVVNNAYVITFVGAKAGLGELDLVFWSPAAGTDPKVADTYTVKMDVKVMGELGLEMGTRDNLITGKNADTGTYKFQILFGGIPIDAAAEIANGNLTAVREVGAAASTNANVTTIDSWSNASFNYTLNGCVVPGATANVSDFINLTYKYGGKNYTRRVEIPLKYTSSTPVFTGWPTAYIKVFAKGTLAPVATCDGVTITSGISSIGNYGEGDDYVTLGAASAKSYEIINGDTVDSTHNVHARVIGQYRSWVWSVEVDIPFNIAAWNQKTWDPNLSGSPWSVYLDLTGRVMRQINLTGYLRNGLYSEFSNATGDLFLPAKSDLLGLVDFSYYARASATTQYYQMFAKKPGTGTLKLCFKNPEASATPGVEGVDFTTIDYPVEVKENSLYGDVGTGAAKGGSGDTVTGSLVVRLTSNNSAIPNTNAYLAIAPVDEKVFKITGKAATTITVQVTADYTVPDGVVKVPMTFTYTDPNTGFVTKGTFDYPFTIQRPSDWPVVTQSTPANTVARLWDYGPIPFKVTVSGTDVSSQVVPTSCVDDAAGPGGLTPTNWMELSLDQPVTGTWWWITKYAQTSTQQTRTTKWKLNVPYRGNTVSVDANFTYIRAGDGSNPTPEFQGSTSLAKTLMQNVGDQVEIPFALLWRNYKYSKGVFKPELSGTDGAKFSDYFKVVSQRYDDSTGNTYLKIEMTQVYEGSMAFVWDTVDNLQNPVVGTNRVSVSTSFYDLTITDLKNNDWTMWASRRLNTLISIKDGDTELAATSMVTAINNAILVPKSTTANPLIRAESDVATDAFTGNVVYTIQLPAAYSGRTIKVTLPSTIAAYDGNEFTVEVYNYSNQKASAGVNFANKQVYVTVKYRGVSVAYNAMGSDTALLKSYNPDATGVYFGTISYITPSNWTYYSFGSTSQYYGDLKIPIRFTGTAEKVYPKDTEGKNLNYLTIPVQFFEPKLYLYPGDSVPATVTAAKTGTLAAPVMFSMGKNLADNQIAPNNGSMSWAISGNTMSGIVSKPSSGFSSATGIVLQVDYDNRGDDITVDVPVRMTYNGTYTGATNGNGNYTINSYVDYVQKVLIKGTKAGNTVTVTPKVFTNMRVWDVSGPALTIVHNGTTVTAANIKEIKIAANPYIRIPETSPNTNTRWFEIYNGKTDGPTDTVATFTVTYTDGLRDYTITQDVSINIQKYSGSPWNVVQTWSQSQSTAYALGIGAIAAGYAYGFLQVYYKNAILTEAAAANYAISTADVPTALPGFTNITQQGYYYVQTGNLNAGPQFQFQVKAGSVDTLVKKKGKIKFGFKDKVDDPTSVEGQDWVYVNLETVVWADNNQYYLVSQDVTEYTGKYGDANAKFPFTIRKQNTMSALNATANWAFTNNGNLQAVYNQSDAASVVTANFSKELTTSPKQTLDTVMWLGYGLSSYSAKATVKVTQVSNYAFPTVSNVNKVTATLNQSGGLPFKLTDDSGADVTSQATITAISTNDYIKLDSAKWVCYNTRSADTEIQVTFTYQITYKGNLLTMTQDVPYLIKAFTEQPTTSDVQVVNAKVWDIGSKLPFTINISGNPVPASWITAITGTSANSRVQVTSLAEPWYVVAGSKDAAVSDTVSYTVTVTNGTSTWTVKQDVVFNIAKYDGVELVGKILTSGGGNAELQTVFYPYNATSAVGIIFNLYSKGRLVNVGAGAITVGPGLVSTGSSASTTNATYNIKGNNTVSGNTETYMTVKLTVRGNTGTTEGIDFINVTIPVFMVQGTGQLLVHPRTTKAMTGKYGTPVSLDAYLIKYVSEAGSRFVDLTTGSTSITFAPSDVITLVPGSITAQGYKVNFASRLYVDTVKDVVVTVTNGGVSKTYTLNTTQLASPADQPDVKNNNGQTASVNQSGAMPFKLVDPDTQEDVTSKATISSIASNDYIELVNGKWYAKKDVATDTHTNVTFTLTLNYRDKDIGMDVVVDFLIKPFDGKFTVTDKKDITAKVWERGTTPPFGLSVNGNPVPASWIASWGTSPTDTYVAVAADGSWQVIAGDQTKGITVTVGYAANITVPGGNTTKNVTQVTFNISQYDGIEFKLNLANLQAGNKELQAIFLTYNATSTNGVYFEGRYRGDLVPSPIGVSLSGGYLRIGNGPINGASYVAWAVQPSGAPARGTANWTARIKRASSAGNIENSDVTSLLIPTYFVVGAGDMFVHTGTTKTASGKKGDQLDLVLNMFRYSGTPTTTTLTDLTAGSTTIEFSPANVIELVPGSITAHGYKVRFINTLYQDTNTQVTATVKTVSGNVSYVIDVTQLASPAPQPNVVGNNTQTAGINQTGTMPFKLVDPDTQQDVTSAATVTSVDSNPYVEWVDGKWRVKSDVSADTHSNVTFNLTITYRGITSDMHVTTDFLIKPFDGVFTFGNVEPISGNVWDRGTAIDMGIKVNGNAIPVDWITGYLATPESNYVTVAANGVWQIVAGSKDEAITKTVGYTATVAIPGTTSYPATVQVTYNIGKYDGVEFKLRLTNLNADDVLFGQAGLAARGYLEGRYRNDLIGGTSGYGWTVITSVNLHPTTPISGINLSGSSKIYDFNTVDAPAARAQNVVRFVRPGGKDPKTDNTAVKDVDYVDMVIPITTWKSNTLVAGQTPVKFEGKLGDVLDVRADAYYSSTKLSLNSSVLQITPDASLGIEIVPDSITADGFKVRFVADVTKQTTVTSVITYKYTDGSTTGTATAAFTVVQNPGNVSPDVNATGTMAPMKYGETGNIVLTGTVGSDALAGKVTFVPASSDNKGLVTFGDPVNNEDGTVSIPVTADKVGKDNLTIHITVNGATGNVSGKDYLDVIVAAEVTYGDLGEGDGFETNATGTSGEPVTVTQWTYMPEE